MECFGDAVFCTHRNRIANSSHYADVFRGQIMNWNFLKSFFKFRIQPTFHAVFMTPIDPHKGICTGKTVYELWFMNV